VYRAAAPRAPPRCEIQVQTGGPPGIPAGHAPPEAQYYPGALNYRTYPSIEPDHGDVAQLPGRRRQRDILGRVYLKRLVRAHHAPR